MGLVQVATSHSILIQWNRGRHGRPVGGVVREVGSGVVGAVVRRGGIGGGWWGGRRTRRRAAVWCFSQISGCDYRRWF